MTTYRLRAQGLNWREIEGELIAVDVPSSTYLTANSSGGVLWRALAGGATRDDLVGALVSGFGIGAERASSDVDRFLAELDGQGLLERRA